MPRPPLPLGSHGKINVWSDGGAFVARTQFRDYDGFVRPVKRRGKSKAAAERALKATLTEREAPFKAGEVTLYSTVAAGANLGFEEVKRLVAHGQCTPVTLYTYRYIYSN